MSENPYQPPESQLHADDAYPPGARRAWKLFFWIAMPLFLFGALGVLFIPSMSPYDWLDLGVSGVSVVGLGGLAFQRGIGPRRFWIVFFAFSVLWNGVFGFVFPLLGIPVYGQLLGFGLGYAISILFTVLMLYANYVYAWRADHLWETV